MKCSMMELDQIFLILNILTTRIIRHTHSFVIVWESLHFTMFAVDFLINLTLVALQHQAIYLNRND